MLPLVIILGSIISAVTLGLTKQKENFAGMTYPMTLRADGEVKSAMGPNFYSVPGAYQASLSPRFSNLDYGSQIRFNFPPTKYLATPEHPLSYKTESGDMRPNVIKEGFCGETQAGYTGPPPDFKFGEQRVDQIPKLPMMPMMSRSGYKELYNQGGPAPSQSFPRMKQTSRFPHRQDVRPTPIAPVIKENFTPTRCNTNRMPQAQFVSQAPFYSGEVTPCNYTTTNYRSESEKNCGTNFTDTVPIGTVTMKSSDGTVQQPIVYDRFIYANQRSRLQSQGDRIRGDLPILPNNSGWFQVAVNPTVDLTNSALSVVSGDGETSRKLQAMKTALTMGTINTFGSMGTAPAVQKEMMASDAGSTITYTAFP